MTGSPVAGAPMAGSPLFRRVALIGLGLIGGSLALAMRRHGLAGRLVGADHNPDHVSQALALGLVNEVAPRAELDAAVERWLKDILACAPLSLRAIKQTVRRTAHLTAVEAQAQRSPALIECLQSHDGEEGVLAFREKRAPVWTGR